MAFPIVMLRPKKPGFGGRITIEKAPFQGGIRVKGLGKCPQHAGESSKHIGKLSKLIGKKTELIGRLSELI